MPVAIRGTYRILSNTRIREALLHSSWTHRDLCVQSSARERPRQPGIHPPLHTVLQESNLVGAVISTDEPSEKDPSISKTLRIFRPKALGLSVKYALRSSFTWVNNLTSITDFRERHSTFTIGTSSEDSSTQHAHYVGNEQPGIL